MMSNPQKFYDLSSTYPNQVMKLVQVVVPKVAWRRSHTCLGGPSKVVMKTLGNLGKMAVMSWKNPKSPFIKFQDIWGGLREVLKEKKTESSKCLVPKILKVPVYQIFSKTIDLPKMLVQSNCSLLPSLKVGTMEVWDRSDGDSGIQTFRILGGSKLMTGMISTWRSSGFPHISDASFTDKNRSQPKPCKESVYATRKHLCWFILQEIFQDFTETLATTHAKSWWFSSAINHALASHRRRCVSVVSGEKEAFTQKKFHKFMIWLHKIQNWRWYEVIRWLALF